MAQFPNGNKSTVAEIDDWEDCLPADLRRVWPVLASVVGDIDGCLFGGTAIAIHLRHRQSFDLDYMTAEPFDVVEVAEALTDASGGDIRVVRQDQEGLHAIVGGVTVEIFRTPERGYNPGRVTMLDAPTIIDGLKVASLADLLASKLDILLYRQKLRDFIDLAAIDTQGPYSLEDGLLFHMARYGPVPEGHELSRIVNLLADPGQLDADPAFDRERDTVLTHLRSRAHALRGFLHHRILSDADPTGGKPVDRPGIAGLTTKGHEILQSLPPIENTSDRQSPPSEF